MEAVPDLRVVMEHITTKDAVRNNGEGEKHTSENCTSVAAAAVLPVFQ